MYPFFSAGYFFLFFKIDRFYELPHENETGYIFLLESLTMIAQYHTETGFCIAMVNRRGELCLDLKRISCGVGRSLLIS